MPRKSDIALLLVSTVLCLLAGELILRWVAPVDDFNHHQLYCEYDPVLGWRKIPNTSGKHHTPEYEVMEHINSMGIRGPEYSLVKPTGEQRIVVLGDSFAEGYTVSFENLFSEVLKDSLRRKCPGSDYEVINTGTGGYSTDQELLCFENLGRPFQPDFTILMFCINDPWFNIQPRYWRGDKPQFLLEGDSLRLTNVPVPEMASRSFFSKAKLWLLQNSLIIKRLKNLKDHLKYASGDQSVPDEWKVYQAPESAEMARAWQVTAALLGRLKNETKAAGSGLLVFYIPEKIEVHPEDWKKFIETYSLDVQYFDQDLPRRRLNAICDSLQIPLLDPTPAFTEMARADTTARFYFEKDWHWNVAGNKLAGGLLSDWFICRTGN